ncbi:MAG: hypothetical protein LUE12_00910 [Ruminococcus sp.]|nr:hypothetical protein [Ruminococcus sp.]
MNAFKELKDRIEKCSDKLLMAILLAVSFALRLYNLYILLYGGGVGLQYGGDTVRYNQWANEIAENGLGYYVDNIDKPY